MSNSEDAKELIEKYYSNREDRTAFFDIIIQMSSGRGKFTIPNGITTDDELENWYKASVTCHALMVNYWTDMRELWKNTWGKTWENELSSSVNSKGPLLLDVWDDGYYRKVDIKSIYAPEEATKVELYVQFSDLKEDGNYCFHLGVNYYNEKNKFLAVTDKNKDFLPKQIITNEKWYLYADGLWFTTPYIENKLYIETLMQASRKICSKH